MIPGFNETLRVNGRAAMSTEEGLLSATAHDGKLPRSVILVEVEEVYMHCAKALIRSKLWAEKSRVDRNEMQTLGRIIADQVAGLDAAETDAAIDENYRQELY